MLDLGLRQSQNIHMNLNLRMSIDLLSKNQDDLIDFVNKEALENVFIEFIDRDLQKKKMQRRADAEETEVSENIPQTKISFEEMLFRQLGEINLDDTSYLCGKYIIESLDERGYFTEDANEASAWLGVFEECFLQVLKLVQSFEPAGVASRNYIECLLAQTNDRYLREMIEHHLEDIADGDFESIAQSLGITVKQAQSFSDKIRRLRINPRLAADEQNIDYIYPEVFVKVVQGELQIEFSDNVEVKIDDAYFKMYQEARGEDRAYLREKLYRANYLKKAMERRRENLKCVMEAIADRQKDFFLHHAELRPLSMSEIAGICNVSQSTVSRIAANKYLEFERKNYPLKSLFQRRIHSNDEETTGIRIIQCIRQIIHGEDKKNPLSDEELSMELRRNGIDVKRRTVTKYRKQMGVKSKFKRALRKDGF